MKSLLLLSLLLPAALSAAVDSDCCYDADADKCYRKGQNAMVTGADDQILSCTCAVVEGAYSFKDCKTTTCLDNVSDEYKKKGEAVRYKNADGSVLHCTCNGEHGYAACRTEEQLANENKCKDHVTGKMAAIGEQVKYKQEGKVLVCKCKGTNKFAECRTEQQLANENKCKDHVTGKMAAIGEQVKYKQEGKVLVCKCKGTNKFADCRTEEQIANADKCKDVNGKFVEKNQRYRVKFGSDLFSCVCDGNNAGKDCSAA